MAGAGSVSWLFSKKGYILIDKTQIDENKLMEITLEAGAEDIKQDDKNYEVITQTQDFEKVKSALSSNNITWSAAELTMVPSSTIKLFGEDAKQVLDLVESLEEHEDVQNVYANFDIHDEILQERTS